mgnify:CR=1 FL=1
MKITAALSHGADTPFELAEVELDEPRADEVLVAHLLEGLAELHLTDPFAGDLLRRDSSRGGGTERESGDRDGRGDCTSHGADTNASANPS